MGSWFGQKKQNSGREKRMKKERLDTNSVQRSEVHGGRRFFLKIRTSTCAISDFKDSWQTQEEFQELHNFSSDTLWSWKKSPSWIVIVSLFILDLRQEKSTASMLDPNITWPDLHQMWIHGVSTWQAHRSVPWSVRHILCYILCNPCGYIVCRYTYIYIYISNIRQPYHAIEFYASYSDIPSSIRFHHQRTTGKMIL